MRKIKALTPAQIARFGEWAQKWIEIGLSTEPADFDKASNAAFRGYELVNLARPMVVLRMGSPFAATMGGAIASAMLREVAAGKAVESHVEIHVESQVGNQIGNRIGNQVRNEVESQVRSQIGSHVWNRVSNQIGNQVWSQVESQVRRQVWNQVRSQVESQIESHIWSHVGNQIDNQVSNQVWGQVGNQIGNQVWSQVSNQVWSQVSNQIERQIRSQVWNQIGDQVWSQVSNEYLGSLYAAWGAFVSFLRDVCGWEDPILDRFKIGEDLIQSCGAVLWHENVLAISDRPLSIVRDDQGRLHNPAGPSMLYRDGWSLWHWHGVAVPEVWITDSNALSAKSALEQENVEERRAACEIVGWNRILSELNGTTINRDDDPQIGELIEVNLPDAGRERFLRVRCGTGRDFAIPVPPTMKTALEANAWTYDIPSTLLQLKESRT